MIRTATLLCVLCTFQFAFGQSEEVLLNHTPIYYGIDDGLPSQETYDILQDHRGIIWVASDRGIASFNGYEFNTYTTADGLADNCIINMDIDSEGRIWLLGVNGQLTFGSKDKWTSPQINHQLSDPKKFSRPVDMAIDDGDTVWIFYSSLRAGTSLVKYHHLSGESKILSDKLPNCPVLIKSFDQKSISALHFPYNNEQVDPFKNFGAVSGLGGLPSHTRNIPIPMQRVNRVMAPAPSFVYNLNRAESDKYGRRSIISMDNVVYIIMDESVTQLIETKGRVLDINLSKDSLWLAIQNHGASTYLLEGDSFVLRSKLLRHSKVSSVFKDRDGHMWFSTLDKGLVHVPISSIYTPQLNELEIANIRKIRKYENHNIILSAQGDFHVLSNKQGQLSLRELRSYHKAHDFSINRAGIVWPTGYRKAEPVHIDGHPIKAEAPRGMLVHFQTSDGLYAGARYSRAYIGRTGNIHGAKKIFDLPSLRPSLFHEDTLKKCLLLGTSAGLFQITTDSFWRWKPEQPFSKESITAIAQVNSDYLFGTLGNGIYWQTSDDSFQNISRQNGLLSNAVNDLVAIDSNRVAIASNKGVTILQNIDLQNRLFIHLNVRNGLLSNEVQALSILGDYLVIGTARGLNLWKLNSATPIKDSIDILIDKVVSQTKQLPIKNAYEIRENEDGLDFSFTGLDYGQHGNITYAYRLNPFHKSWITTQKRSIQFNSLSHGDYQLEISAIDPTTKEVIPKGKKISISVSRPYYKSPWFSIGLSLVIILFVTVLSYVYIKIIKRQNVLQHQLLATEQNALKAQMNPHFLFNAMNSVQNFIAINDKKAAFTFIAKFSQLVRSIVDNSNKKLVSLHEEIEGWKAYLELEKIRFDHMFSYDLYVNKAASFKSQEIEIPGMLVQPILENALLHGLRPLNHMGMLSINVVSDTSHLTISVCDNGIGRKKSAENRKHLKRYHNSQGIQNIQKRIELLNTLQKASIFFDIIDIDDDGKTGTLVILKFRTNDY